MRIQGLWEDAVILAAGISQVLVLVFGHSGWVTCESGNFAIAGYSIGIQVPVLVSTVPQARSRTKEI